MIAIRYNAKVRQKRFSRRHDIAALHSKQEHAAICLCCETFSKIVIHRSYFIWHFKGTIGPHSFEALKLSSESGIGRSRLLALMAGAMVLAAVLGHAATVWLVLRNGGGAALDPYRFIHVGHRPMQEFLAVTGQPEPTRWEKLAGFAASAGVTWGLSWMRWRFSWWRLHPVGFAMGSMINTTSLALPVFIAWSLKSLILKFGGVQLYRRGSAFFIGLIVGYVAGVCLCSAVDTIWFPGEGHLVHDW